MEMPRKAETIVEELQPERILGCPPCNLFSILQNCNKGKMDAEKFADVEGSKRTFTFLLQALQGTDGEEEVFLHEHPDLKASWKEEPVEEFL